MMIGIDSSIFNLDGVMIGKSADPVTIIIIITVDIVRSVNGIRLWKIIHIDVSSYTASKCMFFIHIRIHKGGRITIM